MGEPDLARLAARLAADPLIERLAASPVAGELWVVGGAPRDALLGREPGDLDLACTPGALAGAAAVAREAGATVVELDPERGTLRLVLPGARELDLTRLRGPGLAADLAARDFTINAIAVALAAPGVPIDPLGGRRDLALGWIRPCGPGSFPDDPLRALRALRFVAQLGFRLEPGARPAMEAVAGALAGTARERRRIELEKLFAGGHWEAALGDAVAPAILGAAGGGAGASGLPPARLGELEEVLGSLVPAPLLPRTPGARRLLAWLGLAGAPAAALGLARDDERWLKTFAAARREGRARVESGDHRFLPWLWDQGPAGEGALAGIAAEPGGREVLARARPVPKPEPLLDGRVVMARLGLAPGPAVKAVLDRLAVERARGRLATPGEAEAALPGLSPGPPASPPGA